MRADHLDDSSQPSPAQALATERAARLAVFDLDGTLTCRDTYLAFLLAFLQDRPARLLRAAPLPLDVLIHKSGLRNNTWLKVRFLRAILGGTHADELAAFRDRFLQRWLSRNLRPGALREVERHHREGTPLWLVSASLDFYADEIGRRLGFERVIATRAAWTPERRLRGGLDGGNCHGPAKVERLTQLLGAEREQLHVIAYSDDASDLPLLRWADRGIAVNPTKKLRRAAGAHRLEIQDWSVPQRA